MNRRPAHRSRSNSERFGYRPLPPGRIPTDEAFAQVRHACAANAWITLETQKRVMDQSSHLNRAIDLLERSNDLVSSILTKAGA